MYIVYTLVSYVNDMEKTFLCYHFLSPRAISFVKANPDFHPFLQKGVSVKRKLLWNWGCPFRWIFEQQTTRRNSRDSVSRTQRERERTHHAYKHQKSFFSLCVVWGISSNIRRRLWPCYCYLYILVVFAYSKEFVNHFITVAGGGGWDREASCRAKQEVKWNGRGSMTCMVLPLRKENQWKKEIWLRCIIIYIIIST